MPLFKFKKKLTRKQELLRLKREEAKVRKALAEERELFELQKKKQKELDDLAKIRQEEKKLKARDSFSGAFLTALKKEKELVGKGISRTARFIKKARKKQKKTKLSKEDRELLESGGLL